jgi:eukaryotic-like serine/threonine-protein kinase
VIPGSLIAAKYRLHRLVGQGAMGVVWAAVNERTEREVALKLINGQNEELRRRLLREARACGRLDHRNIIEIYDVGETEEGDPFLVMPLLTGETLAERLARDGLLPPAMAARIAADIASGLSAAHAAGIVHRDLKPANVFLHREAGGEEAFVVKVLDFGVSKMLSEAAGTLAGGAVGSPLYMSPEQARGEPDVDHRTDLWATGVVLFEMLTGTRPFHGDTMFTVVAQILGGPIPSVVERAPHVDPALGEIVARCLERQTDRRVGSAAELAVLLHPFAGARERATPLASLSHRPLLQPDGEAPTAFFKKPAHLAALAADLFDRGPLAGTVLIPDETARTGEPSAASYSPLTSTTPLMQPTEIAPEAEVDAPPAASPRRTTRWIGAALAVVVVLIGAGALLRRAAPAPISPSAPPLARAALAASAPREQPSATITTAEVDAAPQASASAAPTASAAPALVPTKQAPPSAGNGPLPKSTASGKAREIIRETPF